MCKYVCVYVYVEGCVCVCVGGGGGCVIISKFLSLSESMPLHRHCMHLRMYPTRVTACARKYNLQLLRRSLKINDD